MTWAHSQPWVFLGEALTWLRRECTPASQACKADWASCTPDVYVVHSLLTLGAAVSRAATVPPDAVENRLDRQPLATYSVRLA